MMIFAAAVKKRRLLERHYQKQSSAVSLKVGLLMERYQRQLNEFWTVCGHEKKPPQVVSQPNHAQAVRR
jgi:hypothetical protein